jgi:hypothetical protein
LALDVLLTFGSVYCAKLSTLVNEERAPDGSLGLQGYDNVTVWVDSGMGVIHALGEHYVEARTSTVQFLLDVLGELRRTTWEEASGHAEQRFRAMLDMVLEQIA